MRTARAVPVLETVYASLEGSLTVLSTQLFHVIKELEETFTDSVEHILHMDKVVGKLIMQDETVIYLLI